jgi:hypothetical protein
MGHHERLRRAGIRCQWAKRSSSAVPPIVDSGMSVMMPNNDDRRAKFVHLRQRLAAVRMQSIAVCADAAATLDLIRRASAIRRGVTYHPQPDDKTFTPERRSRFRG